MIIAVIGAGRAGPELSRLAEDVGEELGRRGVTLVCGGGAGVMEAACRGAKSAGGTTIGILPGHDPDRANAWVDFPIPTGMSQARNAIVVQTGRAVIAVGGRFGTLSEIGHALNSGIPVIGLRTWRAEGDEGFEAPITFASDPRDAVDKALEAARRSSGFHGDPTGPDR
jgi:uncharacterized protein (TIGR00725 family)